MVYDAQTVFCCVFLHYSLNSCISRYSLVGWESVSTISDTADLTTCQSDLALVMGWLNENAGLYNLDVNNIIMGGRSRGSMCSWMSAHSGDAGIKGIYM